MTYLEEFQKQINNRDFSKFLQLWEEYCTSDEVDVEEFLYLLKTIKTSDFAKPFGKIIETALPLWQTILDKSSSYNILKLLIDLQITNSPALGDLAFQALQEKHGTDPQFNEWLRLVGMRTRENFQGAISNYDLLKHMQKGKFVFHAGGWGAGEIIDLSPIRQQVSIEFENVTGRKDLTFDNAFRALAPLDDRNFLARRFADADLLEQEARKDPLWIIKLLLSDLGPKTAAEIKDELCDLVIPEKDWAKWWQGARAKLKKDPMIESPSALGNPFRLRLAEQSQEERLVRAIQHKTKVHDIIQAAYSFLRDLPKSRKNQDVKNSLRDKLLKELENPELTPQEELQTCICLESQFGHHVEGRATKDLIQRLENIEAAIQEIDIVALKKLALTLVKENRNDWIPLFLNLMYSIKHSALRDYILKELHQQDKDDKLLKGELQKLLHQPETHSDYFIWYFQKIVNKDGDSLPFSDKKGACMLFEAFLVLMNRLENKPEHRDLVKKMYVLLSGKRYAVVRAIFANADLSSVKEFLLLASKCQIFTDHDMKILHSLAAVVHPSLAKDKQSEQQKANESIIWTTEEAYQRIQEQVRHIGTIEMVENAREIEAARAHGDLRENSEYKFALEKRSRLQQQLKTLSNQIKNARVITKEDVYLDEVGVGSVVDVTDSKGNKSTYTILGPWDADADRNILSFQSKLAQALLGCKKGGSVEFRGDKFTVTNLKSCIK